MISNPYREYERFALIMLPALAIGLVTGYPFLATAIGASGYSLWAIRQQVKLARWINHPTHSSSDMPESQGLWGEIFDTLFRQQGSHHKSLEELQAIIQRAQQSIAAIRDGVVLVDKAGNLEWCNPAAQQLLGLHWPQDQGQTITNLIRDPRFIQYFDAGCYDDYLEIPAPQQDERILQYYITRFGKGDQLFIVRDITKLHQLEQMRKDFVANVSHELKTPLTVFKGYLETLLDHATDLPAPTIQALQQMNEQEHRMEYLVQNLLLLNRLESTRAHQDNAAIPLSPLLNRITSTARQLGAEKKIQITVDIPPTATLIGNESELDSAFSNLVFNAVKYNREEGSVTIRWNTDEAGGHLCIEDTGIGIEPIHIPRLTERFYRTDNHRNSAVGGTGLGLAIVKHVLKRHDGHLTIDSVPGCGSRFIAHFPPGRLVQQPTIVAAS